MKNLLIVKFPFESAWGGEEEITLLLAKVLRKKKYQVKLLTSCPYLHEAFLKNKFISKKFWFRKTDPVSKLSLLFFPLTAICLFFSAWFWLLYFKRKKFNKVLFLRLQEKIIFTIVAKILGYKVFWGEHCPIKRWLLKNPLLFAFKFLAKYITFITPSLKMKQKLLQICPLNKAIKVLPNAIENEIIPIFSYKEKKNFLIKKIYNYKKQDLLIGFAGRLSREKGLFFVLKVMQELIKKNKNIKLIIAGKGPLEKEIRKEIKKKSLQKNVFLCGFLQGKALQQFFSCMDLFCLFSDFETFGLTLLQAISYSKPVVATNKGAIAEIIIHQENGFLINDNTQKYAQNAVKYISFLKEKKQREKMGLKGREIFLKNFSLISFTQKAEKIFK